MQNFTNNRIIFLIIFAGIFSINLYGGWWGKGTELINKVKAKNSSSSELTTSEIANGLKEALKVGTENVVKKIGKTDGFFKDPNIHIPLPENLRKVKDTLSKFGLSEKLDQLELKLNRAAELATPKAKKLFWDAIKQMTIGDVNKIYHGPEDAATQYFKSKMSEPLKNEMKPVVEKTINQVKAVQTYNSILKTYNSLPFVKPINGNLTEYVLNKTLDGIFFYLAKEEAAIRRNPAKRTTELLRKVFGGYYKK